MDEPRPSDDLRTRARPRPRRRPARHHEKAAAQGKLPVRERVALLLDEGSFVEDGLLANGGTRRARRRRRGHRASARSTAGRSP